MFAPTDFDPKFKYEISKIPGAEKIMRCFQCGTCTAGCPVARFSDSYRPRRLARMIQLGLKDKVLSSDTIWFCSACSTCVDHCPQDVKFVDVLRVIQNIAIKEGYMPAVYRELASNILKTGYAYKIPESRLRMREEKKLPTLPKGSPEKIKRLFDITGFSEMLERVKA